MMTAGFWPEQPEERCYQELKQERQWKEQVYWGMWVNCEVSNRHSRREVELAIEYMSLEFKGVVWVGDVNLKVVSIWIAFNTVSLDDIMRGVM